MPRAWLRLCIALLAVLGGLALPDFSAASGASAAAGRASASARATDPPFAYVANTSADTVSVVNTATNTVAKTIRVGTSPLGVAVTPDGGRVYVANCGEIGEGGHVVAPSTVSVIDTSTNTVTATIPVNKPANKNACPAGVAVTPNGRQVYVANYVADTVSVIATATNTVTANIPQGYSPEGVAAAPDGRHVYVTNYGFGTGDYNYVSVIDTATNKETAVIGHHFNGPRGIAVTPDGRRVYVANFGHGGFANPGEDLSVITAATNTVTASVPTDLGPLGVAVTPDGRRVYVANALSETVNWFNTAEPDTVFTIHFPEGSGTHGVAVAPDGRHVYVTNGGGENPETGQEVPSTVSVIDTATGKVAMTIHGFHGAGAIAIAPALRPSQVPPPAAGVAPSAYTSGLRFVVYTATDRGVWQKQAGSAAAATPLGGRLVGAPSPINAGGTRIVFGRGTDNALWQKTGTGPWKSLGGRLTSKPGAAAINGTTYRVYVRGADGAVWARNHTASRWGPWHMVGGRVLVGTGPSAAAGGGTFFVLVTGTNRGLFIAQDAVGGFFAAGGVTNSSPALVNARSSGSLVGFAQGTNRAGFFHRFLPASRGWTSMGGILTSGMGGSSTRTNWYSYGLGTDNQVWEHAGTGGATGGWSRVTP